MNSMSITTRGRTPAARSLALLLATAALAGCKAKPEESQATPGVTLSASDVATVAEADIGPTVVVTGALDPADVVRVRAQVGGTLRDVKVDRGSKVSKGEVLARIEAQGITSGVESAKANVASAEAGLAVASQKLEGSKKLFAAGALSSVDMKTAQAGYDASVAQVAAARAAFASASEAAGRTLLIAPFDGWVSDRAAEEGESVKGEDPVFTVVDPRTLELKGQVGVAEAASVRPGQPVTFTIDAFPGQEFRGTVARVDPVASAATRQVGVFARLPNADGKVVAGQFAHGRIQTARAAKSVVAPVAAVHGAGKDTYVLVVDGGVVRRRTVTTGERNDDAGIIAVTSGLRAGERIVVTAGVEIGDGTKVTASGEK